MTTFLENNDEPSVHFEKYHALGNDYLVLNPSAQHTAIDFQHLLTPTIIQGICNRNLGLGSDGILYGPSKADTKGYGLKIFNPDGSEAEKSGNGLRIFARYLYENRQHTEETDFTIITSAGSMLCQILEAGKRITVEMGKVSFSSEAIPVKGPTREVLQEAIEIEGESYSYSAATIGNPHCIVPLENLSKEKACQLGPILETHPHFPNRTNVQFLKVLDRNNIQIEIWERGAGYTLASGSSSSAAAAVAHRQGWCDSDITAHMPGGEIAIQIGPHYDIQMTGPVTYVGSMKLHKEAFEAFNIPCSKGDPIK